jgi:chromosome segregation ATPase
LNTSRNRNTNNDSEYIIGLELKLVRILSLIQRYKAAQEYSEVAKRHTEVLEQAKKIEEKNKRLRHVLESCHRLRTEAGKEDPPIDLGNGRVLVSIQDPLVWE